KTPVGGVGGESQILGVTYRYQRPTIVNGEAVGTGDFIQVGSADGDGLPRSEIRITPTGPDTVQFMKILRAPVQQNTLPTETAPGRTDWFDLTAPMAETRKLEMR